MKARSMATISSLVALLLLFVSGVSAQEGTETGEVTLTATESITVAGVRGKEVVRTLELKSNADITGLRLGHPILRDDDGDELPLTVTKWDDKDLPEGGEIKANEVVHIPLKFVLTDVESGTYSGKLTIWHDGGSKTVDVTVSIKDPPLWPFVTLLAGVVLSFVISVVRAETLPALRIRRELENIEEAISQSSSLPEPFQKDLDRKGQKVRHTLQDKDLEGARDALDLLKALWNKWATDPDRWTTALVQTYKRLQDRLSDASRFFPQDSTYVERLRGNLTDVWLEASKAESPEVLEAQFEDVEDQMNSFRALRSVLDSLGDDIQNVQDHEKRQALLRQLQRLEADFGRLDPDKQAEYDSLKDDAKRLEEEAREAWVAPPAADAQPIAAQVDYRRWWPFLVIGLPHAAYAAIVRRVKEIPARVKLWWLQLTMYFVVSLLLATVGLLTLYVNEAGFGMNPLADYIGLFVWGIGADATRASVIGLVKEMRLAGVGGESS